MKLPQNVIRTLLFPTMHNSRNQVRDLNQGFTQRAFCNNLFKTLSSAPNSQSSADVMQNLSR